MALGAAAGAPGGAISDYGIDDKFMKELGTELDQGGAAVLFLIRNVSIDKVLPQIKIEGKVIQTSLDNETESSCPRRSPPPARHERLTPYGLVQTETCEVLSAVYGAPCQSAQRSSSARPARRAIRSSSEGHTYRNGIGDAAPRPSATRSGARPGAG